MSVITAAPPAARRGSALGRLTVTELKLFLRDRVGLVWGVGLPLLLIVILGSVGSLTVLRAVYGGYSFLDVYVHILVALVLAIVSLVAMPMTLASRARVRAAANRAGGTGQRGPARPRIQGRAHAVLHGRRGRPGRTGRRPGLRSGPGPSRRPAG
jgi:hypothetical protein